MKTSIELKWQNLYKHVELRFWLREFLYNSFLHQQTIHIELISSLENE
jgi:hypothetical protein